MRGPGEGDERDGGADGRRADGSAPGPGPGESGERSSGRGRSGKEESGTAEGRARRPVGDRRGGTEPPDPEPGSGGDGGNSGWRLFVRDVASSVFAVLLVGFFLFAVSGVWPPLVAVESGSMLPNMERNDLVFVMEEQRFPGERAEHGVVTARVGAETDYTKFGNPGDVIVYTADGDRGGTPIIHRAMFWVEAGENWCAAADPAYLGGLDADDPRCTADHAGFITKGDNNPSYDQATGLSGPVRPAWVVGTAEFKIPGLGWIRLQSGG
ncbi:MAG: S26 family signal peptidase [Haloarculaceae archaeon]